MPKGVQLTRSAANRTADVVRYVESMSLRPPYRRQRFNIGDAEADELNHPYQIFEIPGETSQIGIRVGHIDRNEVWVEAPYNNDGSGFEGVDYELYWWIEDLSSFSPYDEVTVFARLNNDVSSAGLNAAPWLFPESTHDYIFTTSPATYRGDSDPYDRYVEIGTVILGASKEVVEILQHQWGSKDDTVAVPDYDNFVAWPNGIERNTLQFNPESDDQYGALQLYNVHNVPEDYAAIPYFYADLGGGANPVGGSLWWAAPDADGSAVFESLEFTTLGTNTDHLQVFNFNQTPSTVTLDSADTLLARIDDGGGAYIDYPDADAIWDWLKDQTPATDTWRELTDTDDTNWGNDGYVSVYTTAAGMLELLDPSTFAEDYIEHYYLKDIVPGNYTKWDHENHWNNPNTTAGRVGAPDYTYTQNAGESIGDSGFALTIHLDNGEFHGRDWTFVGAAYNVTIEGTDIATALDDGCLRLAGGLSAGTSWFEDNSYVVDITLGNGTTRALYAGYTTTTRYVEVATATEVFYVADGTENYEVFLGDFTRNAGVYSTSSNYSAALCYEDASIQAAGWFDDGIYEAEICNGAYAFEAIAGGINVPLGDDYYHDDVAGDTIADGANNVWAGGILTNEALWTVLDLRAVVIGVGGNRRVTVFAKDKGPA